MKIKTSIKIQGLLRDKRFINIETAEIKKHDLRAYIGFQLDELQIQSTLTSADDIDDMIKFLDHIRPSFIPPIT